MEQTKNNKKIVVPKLNPNKETVALYTFVFM